MLLGRCIIVKTPALEVHDPYFMVCSRLHPWDFCRCGTSFPDSIILDRSHIAGAGAEKRVISKQVQGFQGSSRRCNRQTITQNGAASPSQRELMFLMRNQW